jgi:hypothetical protein
MRHHEHELKATIFENFAFQALFWYLPDVSYRCFFKKNFKKLKASKSVKMSNYVKNKKVKIYNRC